MQPRTGISQYHQSCGERVLYTYGSLYAQHTCKIDTLFTFLGVVGISLSLLAIIALRMKHQNGAPQVFQGRALPLTAGLVGGACLMTQLLMLAAFQTEMGSAGRRGRGLNSNGPRGLLDYISSRLAPCACHMGAKQKAVQTIPQTVLFMQGYAFGLYPKASRTIRLVMGVASLLLLGMAFYAHLSSTFGMGRRVIVPVCGSIGGVLALLTSITTLSLCTKAGVIGIKAATGSSLRPYVSKKKKL